MEQKYEETFEPATEDACDEDEEGDCGGDDKPKTKERYLAIYRKDADGNLGYVTAPTGAELKKILTDFPVESVVTVWKGKPKELKLRSVLTF